VLTKEVDHSQVWAVEDDRTIHQMSMQATIYVIDSVLVPPLADDVPLTVLELLNATQVSCEQVI
jgi:hypothetical protein